MPHGLSRAPFRLAPATASLTRSPLRHSCGASLRPRFELFLASLRGLSLASTPRPSAPARALGWSSSARRLERSMSPAPAPAAEVEVGDKAVAAAAAIAAEAAPVASAAPCAAAPLESPGASPPTPAPLESPGASPPTPAPLESPGASPPTPAPLVPTRYATPPCAPVSSSPVNPPEAVPQASRAWAWFRAMGSPRFWVAPMVDGSELPFRTLCLRHGADGGYTPMLHARLFLESFEDRNKSRGGQRAIKAPVAAAASAKVGGAEAAAAKGGEVATPSVVEGAVGGFGDEPCSKRVRVGGRDEQAVDASSSGASVAPPLNDPTPLAPTPLVGFRGYALDQFSTSPSDRPVLAQFCANDPETFARAAEKVKPYVDGIDLNLGCPQRIAKKGKYGSFLSDDQDLCASLVSAAVARLGPECPVTVKIRRQHTIEATVAYAAKLERAGASIVAVHGRVREQKTASRVRADMAHVAAVKAALRVPVLANGNVAAADDALLVLRETGADGLLSAEALLEDPALFERVKRLEQEREQDEERERGMEPEREKDQDPSAAATVDVDASETARNTSVSPTTRPLSTNEALPPPVGPATPVPETVLPPPTSGCDLLLEYVALARAQPAPFRMARLHAFRMVGPWLSEHVDLRERLNRNVDGLDGLQAVVEELRDRIRETHAATGRTMPIPKPSDKKLAAQQAEARKREAIRAQEREAQAIAEIERKEKEEQKHTDTAEQSTQQA